MNTQMYFVVSTWNFVLSRQRLHPQNIFQSLEASRSVWEEVECKLRWVNFRRVWDPRRAFRPAFRVPEISDDWYSSTMGVIVISLEAPRSAGENVRCTWEHLGAPATSLGAPQITVDQSGKNNIFFGNAAGAPGNHSYYLSFNNCSNSCIQFVFSSMYLCINVSMYLYSYPSTTGYIWTGCRQCLRAIWGVPDNDLQANSEIDSKAVIEQV